MADFIAVIRRAVDGLSNNTPEMRARVYEKARAAVVRQLENMSPRPPEHMLQRQLDKLDAAIRDVEAEHAEALPAVDEAPQVAMPVAAVAPVVVAAPAWSEPAAEMDEVAAVAEEQPVADALPAAPHEYASEPVAPAVSGDDWADAHMAEPAASPEPAEELRDEPVADAPFADETSADLPVEDQPAYEPVADEVPPAIATEVVADSGWRAEPNFGQDAAETDYAGLYDSRPEEEVAEEPAPAPPVETEPTVEPASLVVPEHFNTAPTAEEAWSQAEEPGPSLPAWEEQPSAEPFQDNVIASEAPQIDMTYAEPLHGAAVAPVADELPEIEASRPAESPAVGPRVDSVEDWLQSRALDAAPSIPVASWDIPTVTETAANRVPELPEIDAGPSVSYTPTDEFPAYQEPAHVESHGDFIAPEGLRLPEADPVVLGSLTAAPVAAASVDPDDFSQWFQDHADAAKTPQGDAIGSSAPAGALASSEWDEHINSFAPSAKGAQVDVAGQADGMEALVSGYGQQPAYRLEPKKRRNFAPVIVGGLVVALVAGGGYLAWSLRDDIGGMVANLTGEIAPPEATPEPPAATPATPEPAAQAPAAETAATPPADGATDQKFTQRLQADGTEIDEGVGSAPIEGAPAEGRSVSSQTVASTVEPNDAPAATNGAAPTQTPGTAANTAAVAGGEKLFLYEERIGQATPVAVPGSISWTAVRENGPDGRPDPQIQGRINVPERGISALLTVKRNTDNSLPASHIIEVVFSVPPDFEGGAIENLQRIAMKRTEQDRGDPLVAVTAKVTDDTYLVALNDFEDVVKRNMELLSTRGWIDIPVTYRNGRRALITLDKGTTGGNVFDQVMREWAALAPAN
ncbi:hypothetical protein J2045_003092 [Peteryoungia aggregata LMG 23059]|uniref:Uncharacterized protein n=1 Tax=Peteryoungia aggregata LMG 23059 TaxID=1368425 RepID=A0ABU0GAB8_9HYPH|nr:hypothetical protein [Peteryoungia aggregata]MDQ0422048.1 hypothetical protein [Peteryoungia aggregata LMG 23059]